MRRLFFLLLIALSVAACGGDDSSENSNPNQETSSESTAATVVNTPQIVVEEALAASVNGEPIPQERLNREVAIYEAGGVQQAADREALVGTVLESLIADKLVEQAAVELGVTVTEAEIDEQIALLEQEAANQNYSVDEFFAAQGISREEYRERLRIILLTQKVNEAVTAAVPVTTTEIHARHILVADEPTALAILEQLNAGADFAQLALQYSLDPSTREAGGDLGWIAPGDLIQREVEDAIFSLPTNARAPQPVKSVLGYHIVESIERGENRPLDPARLAEQRQIAWDEWLAQRRASAEIVRFVGPNAGE